MPSNYTIVCVKCRVAYKAIGAGTCLRCGSEEINLGSRITAPRKNNLKAWKQIAAGNKYWDGRKVTKGYRKQRHYTWIPWTIRPNRKKGQTYASMSTSKRENRPVVPGPSKAP